MSKRNVIQLVIASLAVFGLVACGPPGGSGERDRSCDVEADCSEATTCRNDVCVLKCEAPEEAFGQTCGEGDGFTCQFGGVCLKSCEDDSDCDTKDGYVCEETSGTCWPDEAEFGECESYRDCAGDEYCADGTCLPNGCSGDAGCRGQHICDGGVCNRGCRLNPEGDEQREVTCEDEAKECNPTTNVCEDIGCTQITDCGTHQQCDMDQDPPSCVYTGSCENDAICAAYADQIDAEISHTCQGGQCQKKPPCEGDDDCSGDEICIERDDERNTCRDGCRCTDDCERSCPLGEICSEESKCVPGCTSDEECVNDLGEGHVCSGNQCRSVCDGFSDCQDGFTCRADGEGNSVCQHCTADNQCPPDKFCETEETGRGDAQQDPDVGLCNDTPPACPEDGYGDNHSEPDAKLIDQLPFNPDRGERPVYCRNPSSNPAYDNDGHDWWKFSAGTGKVIDVEIKYDQEAGNLDLALSNSTGRELVTSARPPGNEPGEENGNERIVYGVDAGADFLLQVRGTVSQDSVEYDLSVDVRDPNMCDGDGYEENDEVDEATSLPPDQTETSLNVCGDDKDFYELDVDANQFVTVVLQNAPERLGNLDLVLYDSDGQVVTQQPDSSSGKHELTFTSDEAAKYIVEVRVVQGVGRVDYDMEWSQRDNKCADRYEVNDNCPQDAASLTRSNYVGQTTTIDNLSVCTDKDFYALDLNPEDKIEVTARYNVKDAEGELQLNLFGPNSCTTTTGNSDRTRNGDVVELSVIHSIPAASAGTYYIATQRFQGRGHIPHEIDINIQASQCADDDAEPNDSQSSATTLDRDKIIDNGTDAAQRAKKICDTNADWYCTSVQDTEEIKYEIRFDNAQGDLDAFLYDPSGSQVASSDSSTDDNETVSHQATTGGEHCVKVEAKTAARSNYTLLTWIDGDGPNDPACPDIFENNDSCADTSSCEAATATPDSYQSLLSCSGDDDWYKTCVDPGQTITVDADFKGAGNNMDMHLWEEHADFTDETQAVDNGATVTDNSNKDQCYYYKIDSRFGDNEYDFDVQTSSATACDEDSSEPNNSANDATALQAPGLIAGREKCEDDEDWYAVDLESGKDFEAYIPHDVNVADFDLTLFKGSGSNQVAQATTDTDNESLTHKPGGDDTYYIKVDTKDRSRATYELLMYVDEDGDGSFNDDEGPADRDCPDQYENNDGQSGAASLGVGSYGNLNVCNGRRNQDDDFYKIFVPKDATLTARAEFAHDDGDLDMKMYRGAVGSSSEVSSSPSDSSSSSNNQEEIQHTNSQSGETYYVEIHSARTAAYFAKNYYDLTVSLGFGGTCNEDTFSGNNDSQSDAASLSVKDYDGADGLMLCEQDPSNNYSGQDWFEFTPSSDGQATFGLEHRKALGEIYLELRDSNGTVATATSEFGGNVKFIDASVTGGKTYYLKVHPGGKVIRNAYDLWAAFDGSTPSEPYCPDGYERNDDASLDTAAAVSLSNNTAQLTDPIACGAEQDWYRVDLSGSVQYHLDAFFEHASATDLALEVQDDSGNAVADDDGNDIVFGSDSGDNDEQTTFSPSSTGTYLVGVENKGSGEVTYPMQLVPDSAYGTGSSAPANCPEDGYEDNDSNSAGVPAALNQPELPVREALGACGDSDNFTWSPSASNSVQASVMMDNDQMDLTITAYEVTNSGLNELDSDLGFGSKTDNRATVKFQASSGTDYILSVERTVADGGNKTTNGPYFLAIEQN